MHRATAQHLHAYLPRTVCAEIQYFIYLFLLVSGNVVVCLCLFLARLPFYTLFNAFCFVYLLLMHATCNLSSYGQRWYLVNVYVCYRLLCLQFLQRFCFFTGLLQRPTEMFSMTLRCMKLILLHGNRCGAFRSSFWSSCCLMCSHRSDKCCECDKYANKETIRWRKSTRNTNSVSQSIAPHQLNEAAEGERL